MEFHASQVMDGSPAPPLGPGGAIIGSGTPTEALYEVAMLRAGEYGFRVKLGGGGAMLKVGDSAYEVFQPESELQWVDLNRVALDPGPHTMSLLLTGATRAEALSVTPPCLLPVEPLGGWQALEPLRYQEMAVTLAKALELESNLPAIGEPMTIKGEEFTRIMEFPFDGELEAVVDEPFWFSAGASIVTARARFSVREKGVYSIETRYVSTRPVRWIVDGCLRVVTCPVTAPSRTRRSLALELEPGEHELNVTLPPGALLDKVDIQQRDGSGMEYVRVVEDKGFKLGNPDEAVLRKEAIRAARRLRDRFDELIDNRCRDSLVAMETRAAMALQMGEEREGRAEQSFGGPMVDTGTPVVIVPIVEGDEGDRPVASPSQPGQ